MISSHDILNKLSPNMLLNRNFRWNPALEDQAFDRAHR